MKTLIVTLEIQYEDMTAAELADAGYDVEEFDEGDGEEVEGDPVVADYSPGELARLIPFVLQQDEVAAEMFAGSGIFAKIGEVKVRASDWAEGQ